MSLMTEGGVPAVMNVEPAGTSNNCNNGGFGWGGDWMAFIVLFLLFGMFGWGGFGGFGGGFGNGGGAGMQGALTRGDLCSEFSFNNLDRAVTGVNQGLCDGFYALNTSTLNGFHGVDNAICNLGYTMQQGFNSNNTAVMQGFNATQMGMMQGQNAIQTQLAQCCCDNKQGQMQIVNAIDSNACATGRAIERGFCDTNYAQATNTTAIIQNAHNDTDRVLAKLDAMEMSRKDETIAALRQQLQNADFAASQQAQNNYLVNQLRPCPTPAYITCNPWASQAPYGSCGTYGYGCGCGCNG